MLHAKTRAIEELDFLPERFINIAELESWRKEIYRPVYHVHKWWAQRLGSVFRAILIGTFAPKGSDILELFYRPIRLEGTVIFDPFMGSGITVGEALKLGARAIGRDINPVSYFIVRNALNIHSRCEITTTFRAIEQDIAPEIRRFYQARLPNGDIVEVLYYFWVKVVSCPKCEQPVDLFPTYIFAKHAYPCSHPQALALCSFCGAIIVTLYDASSIVCPTCGREFNPKKGPAQGGKATCPQCSYTFTVIDAVQKRGKPPDHRLYAKMVLRKDGTKEYLQADDFDLVLYEKAASYLQKLQDPYPIASIESGYNTNQVLNYCYVHWHQLFNERQLYCLSILAKRIKEIPDEKLRQLFTCLFSGALEFNNMFASFKGEGTGAIRHMFSHHILKPERIPIEANLWGTPKSSGSFSTLFKGRVLKALDYCENPFEIHINQKNEKVYGLSSPLGHDIAENFEEFQRGKSLYLSCGDSAMTDLASESVDAVITDPPFFDNVHYSQLADFFYVWQRYILGSKGPFSPSSTRHLAEIQSNNAAIFTKRLAGALSECYRVLRDNGPLVFTYHHSRNEGWRCILEALSQARFVVVASHLTKAEMSVAVPKTRAKEPINFDVIFVCRKRRAKLREPWSSALLIREAFKEATKQVARLNKMGRGLSKGDVLVAIMAQVIKRFSWLSSSANAIQEFAAYEEEIQQATITLYQNQSL